MLLTVLDEHGVIQYESPSIQRFYGFDQDELVGESVAEYFHPEGGERVLQVFHTVVTSDNSVVEPVEYRHEQAEGTYKWVEFVASSNPTLDGNYVINTRIYPSSKRVSRSSGPRTNVSTSSRAWSVTTCETP